MSRIIAALLFIPALALAADPEPIRIEQGEEKVLDVGPYTRLAIGQPDVVGVKGSADESQVIIKGRSPGKTTLLVWQKKGGRVPYLITVRPDREMLAAPAKTPASDASSRATEITMYRGQARLLHFSEMTRIAVGDPEIADVKTTGNDELLVVANSDGRTTLLVWNRDGDRREMEVAVTGSTPVIRLTVGEKRRFDFSDAEKVGVPDRRYADTQPAEKQTLLLEGKAEGETLLPVWTKDSARVDYRVLVTR